MGAVLLQCTCRRKGTEDPHRVFRHSHHYEVSFGVSRSSDKACGTSTMLHNKVFPQRFIKKIIAPPVDLEGRCGAVRMKSDTMDILFVSMHFPVHSGARAGRAEQNRIVTRTLSWLRTLLRAVGARCTPIIGMDLNDGLGHARDFAFEGELIPVEEEEEEFVTAGPFDRDTEGVAGAHFAIP
eukprot:5909563-Pyramimonas_sp.AAC.1